MEAQGTEYVLDIVNYRGIPSGRWTFAPGEVVEVRKPNAWGKSSLAAALAACLGGDGDPFGRGRSGRGKEVRDGTPAGEPAGAKLGGGGLDRWYDARTGEVEPGEGDPGFCPGLSAQALKALPGGQRGAGAREWIEALVAVLPGREDLLAALHEAQGEQDPTAWEQVFATVEGVLARYEGEERSEDCWKALEEGLAADEKALRNRFQEHTRRHGAEQPFRVTDAVDWTPAGWMGNERELRVEHLAEQERVEAEAKETLRGAEQGRTRQWERIRQAQAVAERLEVLKGQQEKLGEGEAAPEEQAAQDAEREVAARREAETDARKRLAPLEEALGEAQRTAQARRKEAQAKHAEAVEQRKSAEALIARLRKEVGVLKGDPGICPTCKQPWAAHAQEIAQALQGKEDALGEAQKQLEAAKEAVVRCTEALDKAQGEDTQALEKAKAGVAEAQREVQEAAKARGDAERALGGVAQALKAAKERDARRVRLEGQLEESRAQAQAAKEAVAGDPAGTQAEQRESAAREAIGEAVKRRQEIERALARAGAWREAQAMVAGVDATAKRRGSWTPRRVCAGGASRKGRSGCSGPWSGSASGSGWGSTPSTHGR